jgi:hypothetical protein
VITTQLGRGARTEARELNGHEVTVLRDVNVILNEMGIAGSWSPFSQASIWSFGSVSNGR